MNGIQKGKPKVTSKSIQLTMVKGHAEYYNKEKTRGNSKENT